MKIKKCTMCKKHLSIDDFQIVHQTKAHYRRGKCRECQKEHVAKSKGEEQYKKYKQEKAYREELHSLQKEGKRRCRVCKGVKPLDDFHKSGGRVFYGKKSYCKKCSRSEYQRPYYQSDRGKAKKAQHDKKYKSQPHIKKRQREKQAERYRNDPQYKIASCLRVVIGNVLKRKGAKKIGSAVVELGCTVDELIEHLEFKFYKNLETGEMMNWENHAKRGWHVDHIKPLCSFDLEDPEQFKEACHYTNLQPLWWKENLSKNGRTD